MPLGRTKVERETRKLEEVNHAFEEVESGKHASRLLPGDPAILGWAERAGYQDLEDIEPITVAAYIEILQRQAAAPTVKQHMAAIRMMFSWLTEKGVLAMNPAREVKTERFRGPKAKHRRLSKVKFRGFWA